MLYVCRSLFIALLCGSLLFWDISYKGIELRKIQAAEEIKDSNLGATLTMAATGLIASRLWTYPKLTPDMISAAVGGAAFIVGEISAYMQFKEQLKEFEMDLQMSNNPDQKQIESLEKLLQSYEKAKDVAGQKKGFQLAAAAAFGVAAGIAIYQAVTDETTQTTCLTALSTATSAGLAACGTECAGSCNVASVVNCTNTCIAAQCTPCSAGIAAATTQITSRILVRETPNKSIMALPKVTGIDASVGATIGGACAAPFAKLTMGIPANTACQAYITSTHATMAGGGIFSFTSAPKNIPSVIEKRFFYLLMTKLVKEANASTFSAPLSMMGIASSVAVAFVLANSVTLSNMVDLAILIPKRRAMLWAALMGTSLMASQATQAVIDKLDGNIQKVKTVLARMYQLNPGSFANKPNLIAAMKTSLNPKRVSGVPITNTNLTENVNYDYAKGLPCITPEVNGKCSDMNGAVQKIQGIDNLPAELRKDFDNVKSFGSSINGGSSISSGAIEGAQKLGAQANAINERLKRERKKAWEIINKNSKNKIDPDKEIDNVRSEMAKAVSDSLAKNKLTLDSASKLFGGGLMAMANKPGDAIADAKKKSGDEAKAVTVAVSGEKKDDKKKEEDLDLGLDKDAEEDIASVEGLNPEAGGDAPKSIDDYDLGQNIHKDPDQNLFEIISKRYMNSGYKRLLEKKKSDASKAVK